MSELSDSLESLGSDGQSSSGTAPDPSKLPVLPAPTDGIWHTLHHRVTSQCRFKPRGNTRACVHHFGRNPTSTGWWRQSLINDQSSWPWRIKLSHFTATYASIPRLLACMLLSQWDSLLLQEGVLYWKFHYPDGTSTNFLQIGWFRVVRITQGHRRNH